MAYTDYLDTVEKLYVAYYNRSADKEGLLYWAKKLDEANGELDEIIDAFADSQEAKELYGEVDETTIGNVIEKIYLSLFDRTPDPEGMEYYEKGFKEGKFTPGSIVVDVLYGAQGDDVVRIEQKTAESLKESLGIEEEEEISDPEEIVKVYANKYEFQFDEQTTQEQDPSTANMEQGKNKQKEMKEEAYEKEEYVEFHDEDHDDMYEMEEGEQKKKMKKEQEKAEKMEKEMKEEAYEKEEYVEFHDEDHDDMYEIEDTEYYYITDENVDNDYLYQEYEENEMEDDDYYENGVEYDYD